MRRTGPKLAVKLLVGVAFGAVLWLIGRQFGALALRYVITIAFAAAAAFETAVFVRNTRNFFRVRRIRKRIERFECAQCGYSLRGTPGRCPECGLQQTVESLKQLVGERDWWIPMTSSFAIILPAAGTGTRFGGGDKLLVELAGRTVLRRSVDLFLSRWDVSRIVVVTSADRIPIYRDHLSGEDRVDFAVGGDHRWQSVINGLKHLASLGEPPAFVAVHDAARPLCPPEVIDEAFSATREKWAALPCVAEPATLKRRGGDGNVVETVPRASLFQAQTPQCFEFRGLLEGYEQLLKEGRVADLTDDAQVFERTGRVVPITTGSPLNLKLTTASDVALAEAILNTQK